MIQFDNTAGQNNRQAKVTEEIAREILTRFKQGEDKKKLTLEYAKRCKVVPSTIDCIIRRTAWRCINVE
jgi:hypothetical protein